MNILKKTVLILGICLICDVLSRFLPFPFPGSVLAMILLFLCLFFGIVKPHHTEPVSDFFLNNMALVFVPATVSIMSYVNILSDILWQFILICVVTTIITFAATAYSVQLTIYLMSKGKERKKNV